MRCEPRLTVLAAALAFALGCGDYSNLDVEYFNALPSREDIKSNLPEPEEGSIREGSGAASAVRAALLAPEIPAIGSVSKLYADTRGAADVFKRIADMFVGLIQAVQRHPPTTRSEGRRTWGPFPIRELPQFEFEVVITRDEAAQDRFDYSFGFRPEGSAEGTPYTPFFTGDFVRAEEAHGIGSVHFDNRALLDAGMPSNLDFDWIQIDYDNRAFPRTVRLELSKLLDTLTFEHQENADDSGNMRFVYEDAFAASYDIHSRWTKTGAGRADANVSTLFGPLGTLSQCWNDAFLLTYHRSDFEAPNLLGGVAACALP